MEAEPPSPSYPPIDQNEPALESGNPSRGLIRAEDPQHSLSPDTTLAAAETDAISLELPASDSQPKDDPLPGGDYPQPIIDETLDTTEDGKKSHKKKIRPKNTLKQKREALLESMNKQEIIEEPYVKDWDENIIWYRDLSENGQKLYMILIGEIGVRKYLPEIASLVGIDLDAGLEELRKHNFLDERHPDIILLKLTM